MENIQVTRLEDGLILISLGKPNEVVILTESRLLELESIFETLKGSKPKGVIITGTSEGMFSVGADINQINSVSDEERGTVLARKGQGVYDLIESSEFPVVAAISGIAVGGACELALACDYRIISDHKSSMIGLPEVKLGILPGFGGTQRLPRLVGVRSALDIILAGKNVYPSQAKKIGLVDEVVETNNLLETAQKLILQGKPTKRLKFIDWVIATIPPIRKFYFDKAKQVLIKKTKGFYPAPLAALNCVSYGLENGIREGLNFEAKELGRLIITPECKALVNMFFVSESAKSIGKPASKTIKDISSLVIGAGAMGAGIASALIKSDYPVQLKDTNQLAVDKGIELVKNSIAKIKYFTEEKKTSLLSKLSGIASFNTQTSGVNFVIEAVFEEMTVKKSVLSEVDRVVDKDAIIATNTSSLSVTEIANAISNPGRVIGMHFFNPVEKMPLVEIITGEKTSDQTIIITAALASKLGKSPIIVKDVPGFLVNRVLFPYINEAIHLLSEGVQIETIDKVARDFGLPMGPIRLIDEVGLDVAMHVANTMYEGYGERMQVPQYAKRLVELGRKGKKTKLGFYDFSKDKPEVSQDIYRVLGINNSINLPHSEIEDRLILSLVNEALICYQEGVAGALGKQACDQIDLGSVMGIGFPPFRGGVLYYARATGLKQIKEKLEKLQGKYGLRFTPARILEQNSLY